MRHKLVNPDGPAKEVNKLLLAVKRLEFTVWGGHSMGDGRTSTVEVASLEDFTITRILDEGVENVDDALESLTITTDRARGTDIHLSFEPLRRRIYLPAWIPEVSERLIDTIERHFVLDDLANIE